MQAILIQAGCYVMIIVMGYLLRKAGFFKASDFNVLARIVLKITLPCAIVSNFAGKSIDPAMLSILLISFGGGLAYMGLGWLFNRRKGKEAQAFAVLNYSGYNIGNFAMPFIQSFLGPMGLLAVSLFDSGNAFICLGGAYSVATLIKEKRPFSLARIGKALVKSVPFDCYMIMLFMNLTGLSVPAPVVTFAGIGANANAFLAMLMVGIGFKLSGEKSQRGAIVKTLAIRYGLAAIIALGCWCLPFDLDIRKALVLLCFSPISSSVPAFTADMKSDVGLSSALNSIAIVCSIVLMTLLLVIMA